MDEGITAQATSEEASISSIMPNMDLPLFTFAKIPLFLIIKKLRPSLP